MKRHWCGTWITFLSQTETYCISKKHVTSKWR